MSNPALRRALAEFGNNQSRFAAAIGTSQQLVSYWLKTGKPIPAEFVLKTEEVTGVSRHMLRPDIYPPDEGPLLPHGKLDNGEWPIAAAGKSDDVTAPETNANHSDAEVSHHPFSPTSLGTNEASPSKSSGGSLASSNGPTDMGEAEAA